MREGLENIDGIKPDLSDSEADVILNEAYEYIKTEDADGLRKYISWLRNSARVDVLTGMRNKRSWYEDFESELGSLNRGSNEVHAIFHFDLDHFKQVNDIYGHKSGDDVLRAVGDNVISHLRSSDSAYRLGGEEFLVLFRNTTMDNAIKASVKLEESISKHKIPVEDKHRVLSNYQANLSGGLIEVCSGHCAIDLYNDKGAVRASDYVVAESDKLLYYVKGNGRNNIAYMDGKDIVFAKG